MDLAKIRLSAEEAALLQNADFILTKNNILYKMQVLLGELISKEQALIHSVMQDHLPEVNKSTPKISRGENYKGLPWLVADYPRIFEKDGILAIRQLCWWGNFFSTTLHLSGKYLDACREKVLSSIPLLKENNYWLCDQEDEWQHHFENDYYKPVKDYTTTAIENRVKQRRFIKIAKTLPLTCWEDAVNKLEENFRLLAEILKREK